MNVHIKLESAADKAPPSQEPAPSPSEVELKAMRGELRKLLDLHPSTRRVMRHLVYVDRMLAEQGLQALATVPEEVLASALAQLESMVDNWSNRDLATLRSKMSVMLMNRAKDPFYGTANQAASAFHTESRLHVTEATHSMFLALERQYQDLVPNETLRSVSAAPEASPAPTAGADKLELTPR
ncbi:MAG: hypothetical protein ABI702_12250 [Burkholderiales bacterium]